MFTSKIRVGLVGAGSMGRGIATQVHHTDGMCLSWVADIDQKIASEVAALANAQYGTSVESLLEESPIDVLVEASNSIESAFEYAKLALTRGIHVVLMNAEVDLAYGPELYALSRENDCVVTSDAGDQHGVLAAMITEADLMGFDVVQAGNIKGFLDIRATPESIAEEAAKRKLSAVQCCAYTDGTKLHIEMALLANALGYLPPEGGMKGPQAKHVREALDLFDFNSYDGLPRVDYLLGAEPGGGVYLVVKIKDQIPDEQEFYLDYYKLLSTPCGKFRLLYRPYHLCHLETPKAILAAASGEAILAPSQHKSCDVYAYAKQDLQPGMTISHAIGSAELYGKIGCIDPNKVPITKLEAPRTLSRAVKQDAALSFDDL